MTLILVISHFNHILNEYIDLQTNIWIYRHRLACFNNLHDIQYSITQFTKEGPVTCGENIV